MLAGLRARLGMCILIVLFLSDDRPPSGPPRFLSSSSAVSSDSFTPSGPPRYVSTSSAVSSDAFGPASIRVYEQCFFIRLFHARLDMCLLKSTGGVWALWTLRQKCSVSPVESWASLCIVVSKSEKGIHEEILFWVKVHA